MTILDYLATHAATNGDSIAFVNGDEVMTYGELETRSDRLASYIKEHTTNKKPVVVYGHKAGMMLVAFFACAKSGHAYVPVDISNPLDRTAGIIEAIAPELVLAVEPYESGLSYEEMEEICQTHPVTITSEDQVGEYDDYYAIFTSGSTGTPKGVCITRRNLDAFIQWGLTLFDTKQPVFLNQAPYSFDLSVMDLYLSIASGGTIFSVDKEVQNSYKQLFQTFRTSGVTEWVSTPSFADLCLADKSFNEDLLPHLRTFLFCGEVLNNTTALKLMDRFPKARVVNTYGPSEATCAVTSIEITREMAEDPTPLPVGYPKNGTKLLIVDEKGTPLPDGEKGELHILGDSTSHGYYGMAELTAEKFEKVGEDYCYHTGDKAQLKDGLLHFHGRLDFQVKFKGYRIELGDIEENLKAIEGVSQAVVLPHYRDGRIGHLKGYITANGVDVKMVKVALGERVPSYMVPKIIKIIERFPLTNNGKIDRKALEAEVNR